jgi:hypothetical protein
VLLDCVLDFVLDCVARRARLRAINCAVLDFILDARLHACMLDCVLDYSNCGVTLALRHTGARRHALVAAVHAQCDVTPLTRCMLTRYILGCLTQRRSCTRKQSQNKTEYRSEGITHGVTGCPLECPQSVGGSQTQRNANAAPKRSEGQRV